MSFSSKSIPNNRFTNSFTEKKQFNIIIKTRSSHIISSAKKINTNQFNDNASINQQLINNDNQQQLDTYDPFDSPPSIIKAERHNAAMSIGVPLIQTNNIQSIQICPCCQNPINKTPLSILCNQEQMLFLGVGYPLYYKLARYIGYIVFFVFFISGSGLYYVSTLNCQQQQHKCIRFFGLVSIPNISPQINSSSKDVQFMNMFTAIGIFVFALYIKSLINDDITHLQSKVVCPSQYTIMLQNLGRNFDESQLKKWIREHLGQQPVVINCAYNVEQLQHAYQRRNQITIQLRRLQIKRRVKNTPTATSSASLHLTSSQKLTLRQREQFLPQPNYLNNRLELLHQKQLFEQIQKCDKLITQFKNNQIDCDRNGTAFVTFEHSSTVANILQKHQLSQMSSFFSRAMAFMFRKDDMMFNKKVVKISHAPAPREIIWHNLSYSYFKSLVFQLVFVGSMFIIFYFAFQYQFKFSAYAYRLRQQSQHSGEKYISFQAVIASLIVISLNSLLRIIIFIFSKLKRFHSHTAQQSSFCFYYTLLYVFNSCFMIYIVHGQYPEQSGQLLLVDIHILMIANAFSQPLFKLLDPLMWYKIFWRRHVASLPLCRNPYTQMYMNRLYEGFQISNGDNYQYLARILIIPIWFAYAAPFGVVISFIGMVADYWIGKIMLIRFYKKPQNISKQIALVIVNTFEFLPLIYICGLLQYTYKATVYETPRHSVSIVEFLMSFFKYSITGSLLIISIAGYLLFIKTRTVVVQKVSYHKIQNYFGVNYQTQNPVTRYRGDVNYLQSLINSPEFQGQNVSAGELKMSMGDDVERRRMNVAKIKVKMECINNQIRESQQRDIQMRDLSQQRDKVDDQIRQSSELSQRSSSKEKSKKKPKNSNFYLKRTKSIFA